MASTESTVNKLETTFDRARAYYETKSDRDQYLQLLDELAHFMEQQGYDAEMEEDTMEILRESFLERQRQKESGCHQAEVVLKRILKLLAQERANSPSGLLKAPLFRKLQLFREKVDTEITVDDLSEAVEAAVTKRFEALWDLEKWAAKNRVAFTEMMVTMYHESGLPLHEFCAQSPLLRQCRESGKVKMFEKVQRYLRQYEHTVARPLPRNGNEMVNGGTATPLDRYSDNINIVLSYITEINSALHRMVQRRAFPLQLDVYFVAPGSHQNLNLNRLRNLDAEHRSDSESRRNGAIDGTSDVYKLLRAAAHDMNSCHRQRFILLVIRGNRDDADIDTLYVYRPAVAKEIAPEHVSDHVELSYLVNSKAPIVEGLPSDSEGVLGLCHHLHAEECGKVYLSYGAHKSRVFKDGFLNRMAAIFNYRTPMELLNNTKTEFLNSYTDFQDTRYPDIGRYWFSVDGAYECWEPSWNPENCRAMGNVFISKECTQDLIEHIDEQYDSTERLYYRMDYTVGMQIVDGETVHFKMANEEQKDMTLIHMDLHRGGEALYAVIVPNPHKSKQKWKVVEYQDIGEAFMTKKELVAKYGIFERDLPEGSRAKHYNFVKQLAQIEVNKKLIRGTNWSHIRIVQSKQNCAKSGMMSGRNRKKKGNGKASARSVCGNKICSRRFQNLALESLQKLQSQGEGLTPIAHFKFRKNQYHLEKLLPVHIPDQGLVAISFWFNQSANKTQASGVCLDLTDIRNKANLVRSVADHDNDSWLNTTTDIKEEINNLGIEECEKHCDHRGQNTNPRSKNQRRRANQNKRTKAKGPRHSANGRQQGNKPTKKATSPSLSPPPSSVTSSTDSRSRSETSILSMSTDSRSRSTDSSSRSSSPSTPELDAYRTRVVPKATQAVPVTMQRPPMMPQPAPVNMQRPVQAQFWYQPQTQGPVRVVTPMMTQNQYAPQNNMMPQQRVQLPAQQQVFFTQTPNAQFMQPRSPPQGRPQGNQQQHYGHNGWYQQPQQPQNGRYPPNNNGGYPQNGRFGPNGRY